ncbi:hypothetical protein TA3x_000436 [Tundrisphaera sp. TA3]|uniref:hypothetical protein n=1 Tax=Tundrisphaera sp. TA3 TaxID=3435775 RepID=UPI003EBD358F
MTSSHPWPLSEVTPEEAEQILKLPPSFRDKRIVRLKADIASKAHERRQKLRAMEPAA